MENWNGEQKSRILYNSYEYKGSSCQWEKVVQHCGTTWWFLENLEICWARFLPKYNAVVDNKVCFTYQFLTIEAFGVRRLKTPYRSAMSDGRERDLNFESASIDNRRRLKWSYQIFHTTPSTNTVYNKITNLFINLKRIASISSYSVVLWISRTLFFNAFQEQPLRLFYKMWRF